MFENVLYQNAVTLLSEDAKNGTLPRALLFFGVSSQGKLTAALELGRVLSCRTQNEHWGTWTCTCTSCLAHKTLTHPDVIIAGPRDCFLEILAAKNAFLRAVTENASYIQATRYLFIRSVRKLTARFNPILWADDDKVSKIAPLASAVDEALEGIDPARPLPPIAELEKICAAIESSCRKLEDVGMYESVPIAHIRRASAWARLTSGGEKKTLIIENADRMQESSRNALLKILEEPPEQTIFILTSSRKSAILPTLLSRVRAYGFSERNVEHQKEVISRIFHADPTAFLSVTDFLHSMLPVPRIKIAELARLFLSPAINSPAVCRRIVSDAAGFEPRLIFRLFLFEIAQCLKDSLRRQSIEGEHARQMREQSRALHSALEQVTVYNQSPSAALEMLVEAFSVSASGWPV